MAIQQFGKKIFLEVYRKAENGKKDITLDARDLRIDFDIKNTMGYNRAQFTIYNLNRETIKVISNEERYVSISVSLHGGEKVLLGDDFYISNAVTETRLPDVMTTLYCMSGKRRSFLEKQVDTPYTARNLKGIIKALLEASGDNNIIVKYELFPGKTEEFQYPEGKVSRFSRSVESELLILSGMFNFRYFIQENTLRCVFNAYTPVTYKSSGLEDKTGDEVITIPVTSLRSNPLVGSGKIKIEANLRGDIKPGDVLDTHNMVTATTDAGFEYLAAADQGLKASSTKFTKYCIYSVVNTGSNYNSTWSTVLLGTTAKDGNVLGVDNFGWSGGRT